MRNMMASKKDYNKSISAFKQHLS